MFHNNFILISGIFNKTQIISNIATYKSNEMKLNQAVKHAIQYFITKDKNLLPSQMFQQNISLYGSKETLISIVQDDNQ